MVGSDKGGGLEWKAKMGNAAHMAISLSFSLSMFKRAAVRDFFSAERDLDRSLAECVDRDRDLRRLERDVRLCDGERLDVWRDRRDGEGDRCDFDGDGRDFDEDRRDFNDRRDFDVCLWRDSRLRDRDTRLFDSLVFDWLFLDLNSHCISLRCISDSNILHAR